MEAIKATSYKDLMREFGTCSPPGWTLWHRDSFLPTLWDLASSQFIERTLALDKNIEDGQAQAARWAVSTSLHQASLLEIVATHKRCQVYMDALPQEATAEERETARKQGEVLAARY